MIHVGDMIVSAGKLAKVIAIDGHDATLVRIAGEQIVTFTHNVNALTRLRDALQPRSIWLATTDRDALEVIKEEEHARAEAAENKKRSRKPKKSRKTKRKKDR